MKLIEKLKKMQEVDQVIVIIAILCMFITCFVVIPLALRQQIKTTLYYDAEIYWISEEGNVHCITTENEIYEVKTNEITVVFLEGVEDHIKLRIDKNIYSEIINKEIIMFVGYNKEIKI